ncbi:MAG: hypothetical protein ABR569_11510 [Gaiellaceae bacterium]
MPRLNPLRRIGPLGVALTAYDIYKRLPARQRRQVRDLALKHGPRVASNALKVYARARSKRR